MYTIQDLKVALRAGELTDLGGYPTYFYTEGSAISHEGVRQNFRTIIEAMHDQDHRSGWRITGQAINYEDPDLYCDVTGKRIPSAYAEPDNE